MHLLLNTFSFCDVLRRHTQVGCTRCTGRTSHAGHMSCRMKPDVVHTTPYINIVNTTEPSTLAVPVHHQEFESNHTQLNRILAATTVVTTVIRNPSIRKNEPNKNTCTRTACLSRWTHPKTANGSHHEGEYPLLHHVHICKNRTPDRLKVQNLDNAKAEIWIWTVPRFGEVS